MKSANINDKERLDNIDKVISQLDEQRLVELNNLKRVQEIKNEVLKLEKKRLINKYGEDHPRVQKMSARLVSNQAVFSGLDIERERAGTKTEPLPHNSWRVYGRVFDQKNKPVNKKTIFFTDEKKNWLNDLGSVCTSETGYYSITISEKLVDTIEKQPLYISVSDENQQIIYQDTDPFLASKGLIEYRDIFMDEKGCAPPTAIYRKSPGADNLKFKGKDK